MFDGNRLKGVIVSKGKTQEEIAKKLGIAPKTFSLKIKSGKFDLIEANKMIEILEISNPSEIFFGV